MRSPKKHLFKGVMAVIAAVGGACLEATTDMVKKNFEPALLSVRDGFENRLSPLPEDTMIGLNLMFYIPPALGDQARAEGMSANIPGASCRKPGGHNVVRMFDSSLNSHRTNAVMIIHCKPSGRVSV